MIIILSKGALNRLSLEFQMKQVKKVDHNFEKQNGDTKSYSNTISVLHLNVRSMKPHFDKLESLVIGLESPLEILCLTETWLSENDNFNAYLINGYNQHFVKKTEIPVVVVVL